MDRLAPDRRATARTQPESPAVERADDFAALDPAPVERAVRVRAAGRQHMEGTAVEEDGQAEPLDLDRHGPALGDLLHAADGDETIHPQGIPGDFTRHRRISDFPLAGACPVAV